MVFLDADKEGYVDYLDRLLPLVRPGGLILAHNIDSAPDYVSRVTSSPDLETVFYMQGGGLGITLKKR
jgi:predicted O-methyltransferase YrrM